MKRAEAWVGCPHCHWSTIVALEGDEATRKRMKETREEALRGHLRDILYPKDRVNDLLEEARGMAYI